MEYKNMRTKFNKFLNESVKKYQYNVDKEELDDSINEIERKCNNLGLKSRIRNTKGTSVSTLMISVNGEDDKIEEFGYWLNNEF